MGTLMSVQLSPHNTCIHALLCAKPSDPGAPVPCLWGCPDTALGDQGGVLEKGVCVEGFAGCVGVRQAAGAGKDAAEKEQRVWGPGEAAKEKRTVTASRGPRGLFLRNEVEDVDRRVFLAMHRAGRGRGRGHCPPPCGPCQRQETFGETPSDPSFPPHPEKFLPGCRKENRLSHSLTSSCELRAA